MNVIGLGWLGTRTEHAQALAGFYERVPGLSRTEHEPGLWAFELPGRRIVEVFDDQRSGKVHLRTGPQRS